MILKTFKVFTSIRIITNFIFLFFFSSLTSANEKVITNALPQNNSKEVSVTFLIDEITDINISEANFKIVSEVLFSWKGPSRKDDKVKIIDLTDSEEKKIDNFWYPKFTIANEESPREISVKIFTMYPDGKIELYERFNSTITMDTDIKQYPFGSLDLMVEIAAYSQTIDEFYFKPKKLLFGQEGESVNKVIKGNWSINKFYFNENQKKRINFREKEFSHNEYHFQIHHDYADSVQKILAPIFILIIISLFINFFCRMKFSENADFNINGQLVLLLTLVALRFSLGDELPKTHYLNLTDLLFLSSYLVCSINLLGSIVLQSYYQKKLSKNTEIIEERFVLVSILLALLLIIFSFLITI